MAEARALSLPYRYVLLNLDAMEGHASALPGLLQRCEAEGYTGLNITYPSKQEIIPLLTTLSPEARALNAVNTVVFRDGERIGYNTDCWGFAENFRRGLPDAPRRHAVLMGAGGAGAAVGYAALDLGVQHLEIFDQVRVRAENLAQRLAALHPEARVTVGEDLAQSLRRSDGLVHATPTGMPKLPGLPVPAELIRPDLWIAEVVYVPLETELLSLARERGCRTLDGGGMVVFQAAKAFTLFTGVQPDTDRMLRAFDLEMRSPRALARDVV
jgi:shikimate dehydrogenase